MPTTTPSRWRRYGSRTEPRRLLLLHDDSALCVDEHVVSASILAGGDVVVVALLGGADHLPTRLTLQRDDGRQILEHRRVIRGLRGAGEQGDGRQNRSPDLRAIDHLLLPSSQRVLNLTGSCRRFQSASRDVEMSRASAESLSCRSATTLRTRRS